MNAKNGEFRTMPGVFYGHCATCGEVTSHHGQTDDHGCERGSACDRCGTFYRLHRCRFEQELRRVG